MCRSPLLKQMFSRIFHTSCICKVQSTTEMARIFSQGLRLKSTDFWFKMFEIGNISSIALHQS